MNKQNYALGMIETVGYPSLIAALDTASKSADVKLITYQGADAGLVTIYIVGDVASVKVAVEVGAESARRIGQLHGKHVIARPDDNTLKMILGDKPNDDPKVDKQQPNVKEIEPKVEGNQLKSEAESTSLEKEVTSKSEVTDTVDYQNKTLKELRDMATSVKGFTLTASQIAKAKKDELIKHLTNVQSKKGGDN